MSSRLALPSALAALLIAAAPATAASGSAPVPLAGTTLSGSIRFHRAQPMTLKIDARDPSRATAALAFDGRCKGGGVGEFWASFIPARETVRIRHGRFSAKLTGRTRDVGGVHGRTGIFKWKLAGRFTDEATATAKVSGTARLQMRGHVISRCRISGRAPVELSPGA